MCRRKAFKPVAERARKFPQVHELFEVGNGLPKERKSIQYGVSPHNDNEGEEWYFNNEEDNSPEPVLPIKESICTVAQICWLLLHGFCIGPNA